MSVVFELYMFTPEYSKQIKKRETKAKSSMERDFISEQGSVGCLNTHREMALSFFNIPELLSLIDTAYKLAGEQGHVEPIRELGEREIPQQLATRAVLRLTGDMRGSILWDDEEAQEFANEQQLQEYLQEKTMIEATFLGGADSPN